MEDLYYQEAFSTTKRFELVGKKEFATTILNLEYEIFVVYIISLYFTVLTDINIHPFHKLQIASLIAKKTLIKVFVKYAEFVNIFFLDLASKLPEYIKINNHAIKLVNS